MGARGRKPIKREQAAKLLPLVRWGRQPESLRKLAERLNWLGLSISHETVRQALRERPERTIG